MRAPLGPPSPLTRMWQQRLLGPLRGEDASPLSSAGSSGRTPPGLLQRQVVRLIAGALRLLSGFVESGGFCGGDESSGSGCWTWGQGGCAPQQRLAHARLSVALLQKGSAACLLLQAGRVQGAEFFPDRWLLLRGCSRRRRVNPLRVWGLCSMFCFKHTCVEASVEMVGFVKGYRGLRPEGVRQPQQPLPMYQYCPKYS